VRASSIALVMGSGEIANRAWLLKTIELYGGIVGIPESGGDFVVSSCEREAEYLAQKFECLE
ncbi:hypothetical protein, partial [Klebsiella aerogenes]|uniref:hypothetical protein n=1 Tax=Klebsiella aerogenes TaxID=548 RepID=UPI0019543EFE